MRHTIRKSLFVILLMYIFAGHLKARAEEDVDQNLTFTFLQARYSVVNLLEQKKTEETWLVKICSEIEDYYVVKKVNTITGKLLSTTWGESWKQIIYFTGTDYYLHQTIDAYVTVSGNTTEKFGRVEIKSAAGNEIRDAWPLFITTKQKGDAVMMVKTMYVPHAGKIILTKIYEEKEELFPVYEREEFFKENGDKEVDLQYLRM